MQEKGNKERTKRGKGGFQIRLLPNQANLTREVLLMFKILIRN